MTTTTYDFITSRRPIGFVDGPCTSGKTHAWVEMVTTHHKKHTGRNFLLAVPTMNLLGQIESDLKKRGVPVTRIDSLTHPGGVREAVVEFLGSKRHRGAVLLITHATRFGLPYFHRPQDWSIFFDEVPTTEKFYKPMLPRNWHLLVEHLEVKQVSNKRLGLLQVKDVGRLRRYLEQPLDDGEKDVREILKDAGSPYWMVFVDLASWERLTELQKVSRKDESRNRIYFVSMLSPDAVAGTTIMSADIRHSLLWHWVHMNDCRWVEHKEICNSLRFREYPEELGRRAHVKFMFPAESKVKWSKRVRDMADNVEIMDAKAEIWAADEPTLVIQNNDSKSRLTKLFNFHQISSVCHGLNCYKAYKKLAFIAALNLEGKHRGMLKDLGFSDQVQRDSINQQVIHQAVMRTALRDLNSTAMVEVLVPDQDMADAIARSLGGAVISDLDGKHEPRFRAEVARDESLQPEREFPSQRVYSLTPPLNEVSSVQYHPHHTPPPQGQKRVLALTFHRLKPHACEFEHTKTGVLGLVKLLKAAHKRVRKDKRSDMLFLLGEYAGHISDDTMKEIHGIILDFDDGTCTPQEAYRIFWGEAGKSMKVPHVITNTFSTAPGASKFRVVVIFKQPISSKEQFEAVFDWFVTRLAEEGHAPETSGLDPNSRKPTQAYFLPCTNADHPESAFFKVRGMSQMREFEKYALDPETISPAPKEERHYMTTPDTDRTDLSETILAEAEELKADIEKMTEGRRTPVFNLVRKLHVAGLSFYEIENELVGWAPDANVERHVLGAIESLQDYEDRGGQPRSRPEPAPTVEPIDLEDFAGPNFHPGVKDNVPMDEEDEDDAWWAEQVRLGKARNVGKVKLGGLRMTV
jgi:hypothetical protein